jgi:hypothetical protein
MIAMTEMLGSGIYNINEAATYARVKPQMMTRWLFGSTKGKPVIAPQFPSDDKLVSFLDFVQALAIREIRLQKQVPLSKFRQAIRIIKDKFDVDFPFARRHHTFLLNRDLVIQPAEKEFIQVTGFTPGQRLFQFVEIYLQSLDFGPDGLASAYHIYKVGDVDIVMKPGLRFGEPILPSGYSAMAIWESINSEGSIPDAARVNGICVKEAEAAYKFVVEHLGKTAA